MDRKAQRLCAETDGRIPLYFAHDPTTMYLPLALGMILARLHTHQNGALLQLYRPMPIWDLGPQHIAAVATANGPGVWLFSDYIWTVEQTLALSKMVKQLSPMNFVVHGGPSAPKYEAAAERFMQEHPEVDVIVRGEGEATLCHLLGQLHIGFATRTLEPLRTVSGITFSPAPGEKPVRTPDRDRSPPEHLPSPYLGGHFDDYAAPIVAATIETNRGCPYGCAFCDWGSATLQKIRRFDLDRVAAEIEWIGKRQVKILWIADANYGIFDRDVEITRFIAKAKKEHGYPHQVIVNYAKNATPRLAEIVGVLRDAGLTGQGTISTQSNDPATLSAVRRSNIKTERYDELAAIFDKEDLPLTTDLMIGLPGSTVESFKNDLQHYFDRRIAVKAYPTVLLPNSPMADPEYMREYAIEVDEQQNLVSTSTYTREEREHMMVINKLYNLFVDYGLLRYVLRFLQWDHGLRSLDVLDAAARAAVERADELPTFAWLEANGWPKPLPPQGWERFYQDVARLLVDEFGLEGGPDLEVALHVNERAMPSRGRSFPEAVDLRFDFVKYYRERATGRTNGQGEPRRLEAYSPGVLHVTDPHDQCAEAFRESFLYGMQTIHWELDSELHKSGMRPKAVRPSEVTAPSLAPTTTGPAQAAL